MTTSIQNYASKLSSPTLSSISHLSGEQVKQARSFKAFASYQMLSHRFTSTAASTAVTYNKAHRTSETNPVSDFATTNHTREQIGLFYTVSEEIKKQLFQYGGFPTTFKRNCETFAETCLMIREPALELMEYLQMANYSHPPVKYVLYGKNGTGKSLTLAHVLHFAHLNNFVTVHVPWVWDWFNRSKDATLSKTREGVVDLPFQAAVWLQSFQHSNAKLLSQLDLRTSKEYVWTQREATAEGRPLTDLAAHGINRIKFAADCVDALLNELKQHATNGRAKVLVAINGFDAFFRTETQLKTEDRVKVDATKVSLTHSFRNITKADWKNGAVVVVISQMAAPYKTLTSHLPLYLLGKTGFEHLDPFIPILVPELTDLEFHSMLDYYEDRRWLQKTGGREELKFISQGIPYELMKLCFSL